MYELWSTSSGNIIGSYETEGEALDVVRAAIERYGDSYVDDVILGRDDDDVGGHSVDLLYVDGPTRIAEGRQLADLARERLHR